MDTLPGGDTRGYRKLAAERRLRLWAPPARKRPNEPTPEPDECSCVAQKKNAERDLYALMAPALAEAEPLPQPKLLLRDDPLTERRTCRYIFEHLAAFYEVPLTELASHRRHARTSWVRHVGFYLARRLTLRSLPEIGQFLGGKDHTTVLHGVRKIERLIGINFRLAAEVAELERRIKAGEPVAVGKSTALPPPRRAAKRIPWDEARKAELRRLWFADVSTNRIGVQLGRSAKTITERATLMGLPRRHTPDWKQVREAMIAAGEVCDLGEVPFG